MPIEMRFRREMRSVLRAGCFSCLVAGLATLGQADPLNSNNGLFPEAGDYDGKFNLSNLDYPTDLPLTDFPFGGLSSQPLDQDNAAEYAAMVKDYVAEDMRVLVEEPESWDAHEREWFNMVWRGQGDSSNPMSGREAIMNTNTGQIVPSDTWSEGRRPTTDWMQNFGVIYYNPIAAYTIGQVFEDLYRPVPSRMRFEPGSIAVKIEAVTVQPHQWPWDEPGIDVPYVLTGAAEWKAFRPNIANQQAGLTDLEHHEVQTVYPFQLAIKVKDPIAAPETGWVFLGFVYDARLEGDSAWDKFVPAGIMWGNDPKHARTPDGRPADGSELEETWFNPDAPSFVKDTIGWGKRLAAPMDVAVRHNIIVPSGKRYAELSVSSCHSCHGTAQFPMASNLFPSPNRAFSGDTKVELMHGHRTKRRARCEFA